MRRILIFPGSETKSNLSAPVTLISNRTSTSGNGVNGKRSNDQPIMTRVIEGALIFIPDHALLLLMKDAAEPFETRLVIPGHAVLQKSGSTPFVYSLIFVKCEEREHDDRDTV